MTVEKFVEALSLEVLTMPDPNREITGGYAGDLLSWVMGRAQSGDAWVTIMSNINVVAVASLADTACVVIAEAVEVEDEIIARAESQGVNLLRTVDPLFVACCKIASTCGLSL